MKTKTDGSGCLSLCMSEAYLEGMKTISASILLNICNESEAYLEGMKTRFHLGTSGHTQSGPKPTSKE